MEGEFLGWQLRALRWRGNRKMKQRLRIGFPLPRPRVNFSARERRFITTSNPACFVRIELANAAGARLQAMTFRKFSLRAKRDPDMRRDELKGKTRIRRCTN